MAWSDRGDDRGKRYQVYKDLYAVWQAELARSFRLSQQLAVARDTIRTLTRELADVLEGERSDPERREAERSDVERSEADVQVPPSGTGAEPIESTDDRPWSGASLPDRGGRPGLRRTSVSSGAGLRRTSVPIGQLLERGKKAG
jgi:hypothetical protein